MANTKMVLIEAEVPYDWVQHLEPDEYRLFTVLFLGTSGLQLNTSNQTRMVPLENGGLMTMYYVTVDGTEAVWSDCLTMVVRAFARQRFATVTKAILKDLDWSPNPVWEEIPR